MQRRYLQTEFRIESQDGAKRLSGYAAKYNVLSEELYEGGMGPFREILLPGAFKDRLEDDVTLNYEHDDKCGFFGRTISGTLTLKEDSEGLYFDCLLPPTVAAETATILINRTDLRYCSFAFDEGEEEWDSMEDGTPLRRIITVSQLYDVSVVVRPAYVFDTSLSVRSREALSALKVKAMPVEQAVKEYGGSDPHRLRKLLLDLHEKS